METDQLPASPRALHDLSRYFSTEVINALSTVGGVAIFTRLVDPSGYGEYALTIAASGVAMAIGGEWLQASVLRLVPGLRGNARDAAISAAKRLTYGAVLVIVVAAAIGLLLSRGRHAAWLVVAGGAYAALSVMFLTFTVLFQATLRSTLFARLRSAFSVLRIACAVGVVLVVGRSPVALVMGAVIALTGLLPFTIRELRRSGPRVSRDEIAQSRNAYLGFGLPLVGWYAASQTLNLSDRFFLQAARGSFDVGLYAVSYSLAMGVIAGIMQPLLSTAHPIIVHAWHEHGESAARQRLRSALRAVILVGPLLVAGLSAFGPSLLRVLAPARYETRGALSALLGAGILLWFTGLFLQKELELRLASRRLLVNLVIAALVNVAANILLIPRFGIMGAAIATVAGYGVYSVLTLSAGWAGLPSIPSRTFVAAALGTVVFSTIAVLLSQIDVFQSHLLRLLVVGPVALLGYVAAIALTGELGDLRRDITSPATVS